MAVRCSSKKADFWYINRPGLIQMDDVYWRGKQHGGKRERGLMVRFLLLLLLVVANNEKDILPDANESANWFS